MPDRDSIQGARCLITGASSGLGAAFARHLGKLNARVGLTGRNVDRLVDVAQSLIAHGTNPANLFTVSADLTIPKDRDLVLDVAAERFGGALDLLINAAGVGAYGRFETHDPSIMTRLFDINVFALAEMCRSTLPLFRRGNSPAVINIGSVVSRRALPGRPEYSASKFAVAGLTEALRAEWAIDGIHVMLLNPGFTKTPFEENVLAHTAIISTESRRSMTADAVAEAGLDALFDGRNELTLTPSGRLLLTVNRFFPDLVNWGFGRWTRRLYMRRSA